MTFQDAGKGQLRAVGVDPDDRNKQVFTSSAFNGSDSDAFLDALAASGSASITNGTVVIPGKGTDGEGPKMFTLLLG